MKDEKGDEEEGEEGRGAGEVGQKEGTEEK